MEPKTCEKPNTVQENRSDPVGDVDKEYVLL